MTTPSSDEEPLVEAPAGLLGVAAELLALCDELVNHPGHETIDAEIRALLCRHRYDPAATSDQLHTALTATAGDLQHLLRNQGIIVDSLFTGHPARKTRPPRPA